MVTVVMVHGKSSENLSLHLVERFVPYILKTRLGFVPHALRPMFRLSLLLSIDAIRDSKVNPNRKLQPPVQNHTLAALV